MILPEFPLRPGCFGRFGRQLGVGMNLSQRKMAINDADIIGILVYQTSKERGNRSTARSLKVAVLDDGQDGVFRSFSVINRPFLGRLSEL